MPLPERPNAGEFIPSTAPETTRRRSFRWRVVPIAVVSTYSVMCLVSAGFVLVSFFTKSRYFHRWQYPALTRVEWFSRRAIEVGSAAVWSGAMLGVACAGLTCAFALAQGRWRRAALAGILIIALLAVVGPAQQHLVPLFARMLSSRLHPNSVVE